MVTDFFQKRDELLAYLYGRDVPGCKVIIDNLLEYHFDELLKITLNNLQDPAKVGQALIDSVESEIMEEIYK